MVLPLITPVTAGELAVLAPSSAFVGIRPPVICTTIVALATALYKPKNQTNK